MRWMGGLIATVIAIVAFAWLAHGHDIPALVESDYCYLLTAADRLFDGYGATAPVPVAPHQPWAWRTDWAFLTQWPVGYPVLIAVTRWGLGVSTIEAVRWLGVLACAVTLVGWYVWVRRCSPRGATGALLAAVAAGLAVPFSAVVDPSTDALLIATVPYLLLLTERVFSPTGRTGLPTNNSRGAFLSDASFSSSPRPSVPSPRALRVVWAVVAGVAVGSVLWLRYAGIFLLAGVGGYLLYQSLWVGRQRRDLVAFSLGAAFPIVALLGVNWLCGLGAPIQSQLNLGRTISFQFSADLLWSLWCNFTNQGFYDYHWYSQWFFALFPFAVIVVSLSSRGTRSALGAYYQKPPVVLSAACVVSMLLMLAATSVFFGDKFNFASLERYYAPIKPMYFVLFVVPVLLMRGDKAGAGPPPTFNCGRLVRVMTTMAMIIAGHWIVEQDWIRPFSRWEEVRTEATAYGQWARCFIPGAGELYEWLQQQDPVYASESTSSPGDTAGAKGPRLADNLIIVSNYHEYIALETKIPALPIPADRQTLDAWVERIRRARNVEHTRVLFVLDPDDRWRDYWIPSTMETIRTFGLARRVDTPPAISAEIFEYAGPRQDRRPKSDRTSGHRPGIQERRRAKT